MLAKFGDNIFEVSFSTKETWIKVARHMEEVNISIKFISEKFEEMEKDRKEKKRQISELKNEVKILNEKIETLGRSFDSHEQYSRRTCLIIHGVKENEKENTDQVVKDIFETEMQEKVSLNDIDKSHRLGKKTYQN